MHRISPVMLEVNQDTGRRMDNRLIICYKITSVTGEISIILNYQLELCLILAYNRNHDW